MEILEHQAAKIRRKTPKKDLGRLYSIWLNFLQIKASQPLYQQHKTLGPKKPEEFGYFEEGTLLLHEASPNLADNNRRKARIFALSLLFNHRSHAYKRTALEMLLMRTLDPSQVEEDEFWDLVKESSRVPVIVAKFLLSKGIDVSELMEMDVTLCS